MQLGTLILTVLALVLFGICSFAWPEPYRLRLVAAGLFCLTLAKLIGTGSLVR